MLVQHCDPNRPTAGAAQPPALSWGARAARAAWGMQPNNCALLDATKDVARQPSSSALSNCKHRMPFGTPRHKCSVTSHKRRLSCSIALYNVMQHGAMQSGRGAARQMAPATCTLTNSKCYMNPRLRFGTAFHEPSMPIGLPAELLAAPLSHNMAYCATKQGCSNGMCAAQTHTIPVGQHALLAAPHAPPVAATLVHSATRTLFQAVSILET